METQYKNTTDCIDVVMVSCIHKNERTKKKEEKQVFQFNYFRASTTCVLAIMKRKVRDFL